MPSVGSCQPEGQRFFQTGPLFIFLKISLQDNLLQLYIRVHYACIRKLTSLLMQFSFLKAFSKQITAFHQPRTYILKRACQSPVFCALSVCQYIYRKTLCYILKESLQKDTVHFPKGTLRIQYFTECSEVSERLTHHRIIFLQPN